MVSLTVSADLFSEHDRDFFLIRHTNLYQFPILIILSDHFFQVRGFIIGLFVLLFPGNDLHPVANPPLFAINLNLYLHILLRLLGGYIKYNFSHFVLLLVFILLFILQSLNRVGGGSFH